LFIDFLYDKGQQAALNYMVCGILLSLLPFLLQKSYSKYRKKHRPTVLSCSQ